MKPSRWVVVSVLAGVAAVACKEKGRPDPNVRMAISHERMTDGTAPGQQAAGPAPDVPNRLEVPPEVQQAYTGVRLSWKDKSNGQTGVVEVPLTGGTPLPDPTYVVRADVYLPSFTMGGGAITSQGIEEQNPAARITVFQKGKEIFAGWIFNRFPDVHPFENPKYQLHLEGGIPRKG
jgi:hypothetical protein